MVEARTEEAWARDTRGELQRRATEGHWWKLSPADRKKEYRLFIEERLQNVDVRTHPACLAALREQSPHWEFTRKAPEPTPDECIEQMGRVTAGLPENEKLQVLERVRVALGVEFPQRGVPPTAEACRELNLASQARVEPEVLWRLLLEALRILGKTGETTSTVHNTLKPERFAELTWERPMELAAQVLHGGRDGLEDNLRKLAEQGGGKATRELLWGMAAAPERFVSKHAPFAAPRDIMSAVKQGNPRAGEADFWAHYVQVIWPKTTKDELKRAFRDALWDGYRRQA